MWSWIERIWPISIACAGSDEGQVKRMYAIIFEKTPRNAPLISPEMVSSIAWMNKKEKLPRLVILKNGTKVWFYSKPIPSSKKHHLVLTGERIIPQPPIEEIAKELSIAFGGPASIAAMYNKMWCHKAPLPCCWAAHSNYFVLGVPMEQREPVIKTPHKQRFPFPYGEVILAMKLPATHYTPVSLAWKDKKTNPAKVENPGFIISSSEMLAIKNEKHEEVDGGTVSSCEVWAVGPVGIATVSLQGDADLGEGVKHVRFDGQIQVIGGQATAGELVFGAPVEQPGEEPPAEPPAGGEENPSA